MMLAPIADVSLPPVRAVALPQELLDATIDHLSDDLVTLRSLALVSRCTLSRSQALIFSSVVLQSRSDGVNWTWRLAENCVRTQQRNYGSSKSFHSLLKQSPRLAPLVKALVIVDDALDDMVYGSDSKLPTSWLYNDDTLPLVLDALNNLERLSIISFRQETRFDCFSLPLKISLQRILSAPCALHGVEIGFPAEKAESMKALYELLENCSSLNYLSLGMFGPVSYTPRYSPAAQYAETPMSESTPSSCLESLELGYRTASLAKSLLIHQPGFTVNVMCLRNLLLDLRLMEGMEGEAVTDLCKKSGETLETITLIMKPTHNDIFLAIINSNLPSLKNVTLSMDFGADFGRTGFPSLFKLSMNLIDAADEAGRLEKFNLTVNLKWWTNYEVLNTNSEDWIALDRRLEKSRLLTEGRRGTAKIERQVAFQFYRAFEYSISLGDNLAKHVACGVVSLDEGYCLKIRLGQ